MGGATDWQLFTSHFIATNIMNANLIRTESSCTHYTRENKIKTEQPK